MWTNNYVHVASSTQTALAGSCQNDGRIPKDLLYGELSAGKRNIGRSQLRYRDVCKRDMKEQIIDKNKREELAIDRSKWRTYFQATLIWSKKYNHCLRKQIQDQQKLNTVNIVTNGLDP